MPKCFQQEFSTICAQVCIHTYFGSSHFQNGILQQFFIHPPKAGGHCMMDSGRLPAPPGLLPAPPGLSQMPKLPPVGPSGPPMPPISQSLTPAVNSKPVAVENVMVRGGVAAEPAESSAPSAIPGPVPVSNEIVKGQEPATPAEPSAPLAGPSKVESGYVPETVKQTMATFDHPSYKKGLQVVLNLIETVDFLSTAFYCFVACRRVLYAQVYGPDSALVPAVCLWSGAMLTLFGTTMFTVGYHTPAVGSDSLPAVCFVFGIVLYIGMLLLVVFVLLGGEKNIGLMQGVWSTFGVLLILLIVTHFSSLMLLVTLLKKRAARKWKDHPENEEAKEELEYATIRMQAASMEVPALGSMVMWFLSPENLGQVEKYRYWYKIGLRFVEDIPSFVLSFCDLVFFGGNFVAMASLGASFVLMMVWLLSYVLDFAKEITKPMDTE